MKTLLDTGYSKLGQLNGVSSFYMKRVCLLTVIIFSISISSFAQVSDNHNDAASHESIFVSNEMIEALVDTLSRASIKEDVLSTLRKQGRTTTLFSYYLDDIIQKDRIDFFKQINLGLITPASISDYIHKKKQAYINCYQDFLLVQDKYALKIASANNAALAVNGPCTNIDFENGSTSGWMTSNADACQNATPCNANFTGASRIKVMDKTMSDPYIPGLSVVNPISGNYSILMEDYENGGNATVMRQTFQVSATNNVFTYHYAAVLEDPQENHYDNERPYFKVRMLDANGREIRCASYQAIAKPPINSFTHVSVPNPNAGSNGGAQTLELYYRNWSTVSIPLLNYIGQNVTIEFSVSDCSRGAHLGYAYVDAECFELNPSVPDAICNNQTVSITASGGFAAYNWSGPGIVGSSTNQTVRVNRAGDYSVRFTPFADNPCPVTLNVKVLERCKPSPISTTLCEDVYGTLKANNINLQNYNTLITAYHTGPATVVSWHSALPASNTNKITMPSSLQVKNGDKFFAVINYSVQGGDTAELRFVIKSKPLVQLPALSSLCIGSSAFQITGASPAGGVFSGTGVNASGLFTPTVAGTFNIKYSYINASGCIDSANRTIIVVPRPTVNAGQDQTICSNATSISLTGRSTNNSGVAWSNGGGAFNSITSVVTDYKPSAAELASSSFTLTLTAKGITPCASVTDQIKISVQPTPTVDAGPAQTLCSTNPVFTLNGTSSNSATGRWTGGTGTFSNSASATTTYIASTAEINSGSVTLNYSVANANSTCPGSNDNVVLRIIKAPIIDAGPAQQLCANTNTVQLNAIGSNSSGTSWSGGLGNYSAAGSLSSSYTPTANEISSGQIQLTIIANGNSPCASASDQVIINFVPIATVNAGPTQQLCADASTVSLAGSATNFSGVKWSGGTGTFSTVSTLQSIYTPSAAEKQSGTVTLTLLAIANAPCSNRSSNTTITFVPVPTVDAGIPQVVCASTSSIILNGSTSNSSAVQWSGGAGSFSAGNSLNTSYNPTATEKTSGFVVLKLTAQPNAPCTKVDDDIRISFDPIPVVTVPGPITVCGNNANTTLTGNISNASNAIWSGGNGTLSPSVNSLSISYTPSASEISAGVANLTLTSIQNSTCPPVSSSVTINITPPPIVDAGNPLATCFNKPLVSLQGDVRGTTNYVWTSRGNGLLSSTNVLNPNYELSSSELANGSATLILTAFAPLCNPVFDSTMVNVLPLPSPDLGPDITNCEGTSVLLSTLPISGATYSWTKDAIPLSDNSYSISVASILGSTKYVIEVIDNNLCHNVDSIVVKGKPLPIVSLNDIAVCDGTTATLKGIISNYQDLVSYSPIITWQKDGYELMNNSTSLQTMEAGVYTITVNSANCLGSDNAKVTIHPFPIVSLPTSFTYCSDVKEGVIVDAGPGVHYLWEPGLDTNKIVTISQPGIHSVTVTNQYNCSYSASTLVRDICPPRLFIGDAFSPDNDGINDHYNVYGDHIGKFHLLIFNRWGEIIYESNDRLKPWDGIYKDELIPIGVYPWTITYEGDSEEFKGPYKMEGSVTIVR